MNLKNLVDITLTKGGCTYDIQTGPVDNIPYYALSIHKHLEAKVPVTVFNEKDVKIYISRNIDELLVDNRCIGTWVHNEEVYLDVISIFHKNDTNLEGLKVIATANEQVAAWDLESNTIINF